MCSSDLQNRKSMTNFICWQKEKVQFICPVSYTHLDVYKRQLQKRAKETKRQEKKTEVKQKDGTVKVIWQYKRKKRFGLSLIHI